MPINFCSRTHMKKAKNRPKIYILCNQSKKGKLKGQKALKIHKKWLVFQNSQLSAPYSQLFSLSLQRKMVLAVRTLHVL